MVLVFVTLILGLNMALLVHTFLGNKESKNETHKEIEGLKKRVEHLEVITGM